MRSEGDPTPRGWTATALRGLAVDVQPGFASGKHNSEQRGIPHLRPMNVSTLGDIERHVTKYIDPALADRPERRLRKGDVLFNNTNSPELVGKTALFEGEDEPAFSNHMTRLRVVDERLTPAFLAAMLQHAWTQGYFAARCNNHVSQASIGRDVLLAFEFDLPPRPVQEQIVDAIHRVASYRANGSARLHEAMRAIGRFRQAVLAAACSGRLTADWRDGRNGRDSRVSPLEALGNGSRLGDDFWPDVPDDWERTTLGEIAHRVTSGSRDWARFYGRGSGTFVMAQNVRSGHLDWSFRQAVDPPLGDPSRERSAIQRGDLLVTIVGANTGDLGLVLEDRPEHYVCQSVALVRLADPSLAPFLNFWFNSAPHGRAYLEDCIYGAGRPHLSFEQLKASPVALPAALERMEIFRRVDQLIEAAHMVAERARLAERTLEKVWDATLRRAFRGELVDSSIAPDPLSAEVGG